MFGYKQLVLQRNLLKAIKYSARLLETLQTKSAKWSLQRKDILIFINNRKSFDTECTFHHT